MENKEIIKALLNAQKIMSNAKKESLNPFFKTKYADLNSIREAVTPTLNENSIVILQPMVTIDNIDFVKTILLHESGESIESLTRIVCKNQSDPQSYGSSVTYARRYGLQSLLSVGCEDDDGNQNSEVNEALTAMKNVKSLSECQNVWNKYSKFQSLDIFINAKEQMKLTLKS